jgi:2-C-methyl-D-erythritol 4-phosphate cytidylyltransferase/2-C-methyl-D-erythritol 2,4-cyclodiphosphate synthase
MANVRIGQGFDAHRFVAGRPLRLCGVPVPGEIGLAGHSDADVALHAVTDAVFGALAAGDLGEFFPPSEERWRDADSTVFLEHAIALAESGGWSVANLDLTIIGERPRVAPHRGAFRRSLADLLGVDLEQVSVKATTTEGMGWTGRGEGLAALAVVLIERAGAGAAGAG